jgi:hypothetical protein
MSAFDDIVTKSAIDDKQQVSDRRHSRMSAIGDIKGLVGF